MGARRRADPAHFRAAGSDDRRVGTAIGSLSVIRFCYFADKYHWIRLDESVYALSFVPFEPRAGMGLDRGRRARREPAGDALPGAKRNPNYAGRSFTVRIMPVRNAVKDSSAQRVIKPNKVIRPKTRAERDARVQVILKTLDRDVPGGDVRAASRSPWELLVATILSAQCTDKRVNEVTPGLFRKYPTPQRFRRGAARGSG